MKRTSVIFVAMLLLAFGAAAQDTVHSARPDSNYLLEDWFPDATKVGFCFPGSPMNMATYCFSKDETTVYGIAAILMTWPQFADDLGLPPYTNIADTTLDSVGAYLRLYEAGTGTLIPYPEGLYVSMKYTPVSYYFNYDIDTLAFAGYWTYDTADQFYFPVYERYFSTPISVIDSFYVGISNKEHIRSTNDTTPFERNWVVSPYFYQNDVVTNPPVAQLWPDSTWRYYANYIPQRFFLFPILTPGVNLPDDTIIVDTTIVDTTIVDTTIVDTTIVDTVGIVSAQLLQRYVNVLPNPAAERVQVASSFGLRSIAVYNAAGARVLEQKATGYTATLDIGGLPEGAYLVRIVTPEGTVTKKLLVRRR